MARKHARAKAAKRKERIRKAHPPPTAQSLGAHPRLVHGFLVRVSKVRISPAGNARPASMVAARAGPRSTHSVDLKREGPAGNTTFH